VTADYRLAIKIIKKGEESMSQLQKEQKLDFGEIATVSFFALAVLLFIVVLIFGNAKGASGIVVKDRDLVIQISEVSEKASFYPVEIKGTRLEVLAVRASDNTVRTAFNTCQVCYGSGRGYYIQEGDVLVCQNCGNRFKRDEVEVTRGGCNPVPITEEFKTVTDTSITISKEFLAKAKIIFANWKS
jgi:uncharacterized membrane protein